MLIIDIHTHNLLWKQPFKKMEETIRLAKKFGINKLCLLGDVLRFGYNPSPEQIKKINDLTIKLVRRWPEFLIGFCFLNPRHNKKFIFDEIEHCIIKEKFKGIKLEISVNARDKRLDPIMKKAEELNIVVLHHSWDTSIIGRKIKSGGYQSDPSDIAELACRFPNVKIIMAHLSGGGIKGILKIKPFLNVWVDTSGSQPFSGIIEYAVKELGPERILYGSDIPGRDFSSQLGRIYGAKIKEKEKRLILGENAKKLLGLKC